VAESQGKRGQSLRRRGRRSIRRKRQPSNKVTQVNSMTSESREYIENDNTEVMNIKEPIIDEELDKISVRSRADDLDETNNINLSNFNNNTKVQ